MINDMIQVCKDNAIIDVKISEDIIKCISDVTHISEDEKKTIMYILDNYDCTFETVTNLRKYIKFSYYQQINGVKYDRSLLLLAENLVKGQGDGRISEEDMKKLVKNALDNQLITSCEKSTLIYIVDNFNVTEKAKKLLHSYLEE